MSFCDLLGSSEIYWELPGSPEDLMGISWGIYWGSRGDVQKCPGISGDVRGSLGFIRVLHRSPKFSKYSLRFCKISWDLISRDPFLKHGSILGGKLDMYVWQNRQYINALLLVFSVVSFFFQGLTL